MPVCILFKIIYLSLMKMCILLDLESNYILWTKVGNLKFKFQQHIKNLRRSSNDCENSNAHVGGSQNLACIEEMHYVSCVMTKN